MTISFGKYLPSAKRLAANFKEKHTLSRDGKYKTGPEI
jgi:hypothetical protein